ncbi:hypothetical protein CRM22_009120 [Opisthorchis felineus]|uniref:Ras-GEF domain-containing protein n=1 Tax=Opisthorchis felineus TaxID=147828 RepID=A0A4S2LF88_OPIFE|nr:hypothetical protein CRM22_009120 [Opisthorchis felineus]TGZ59370.1 hypothetical protein CRM22_009120 [Opisthorchis felineus]
MSTSFAINLSKSAAVYNKLTRDSRKQSAAFNGLLLAEQTPTRVEETCSSEPIDLEIYSGELSKPKFTPSEIPPSWIVRACVSLWEKVQSQYSRESGKYSSGEQLITDLIRLSGKKDRMLASGVWQALLEESAIQSFDVTGTRKVADVPEFMDSPEEMYRCTCPLDASLNLEEDLEAGSTNTLCKQEKPVDFIGKKGMFSRSHTLSTDADDAVTAEDRFHLLIERLYCLASAALLRRILVKSPNQRTEVEVEFVSQELLMVPALANFPNSVRNELSKCIKYEVHPLSNKLVFRQGDPGVCWYIIYKGSVWVHIKSQGYVCRLYDGDDFGKLALVTGDPRAASIILAEDNCHFLRVDKTDYDRVLVDVEANIVRLREGDSDVLVLECVKDTCRVSASSVHGFEQTSTTEPENRRLTRANHQLIIAGTIDKILRHILDARLSIYDDQLPNLVSRLENLYRLCPFPQVGIDIVVEEFILTLTMFTTNSDVFNLLFAYLGQDRSNGAGKADQLTSPQNGNPEAYQGCFSRRVLILLYLWCMCIGLLAFASLDGLGNFLLDIKQLISCRTNCDLEKKAVEVLLKECDQIWNPAHHDARLNTELDSLKKLNSRKKLSQKCGVLSGTRALFTRGKQIVTSLPCALQQLSHYTHHVQRSMYCTPYHLNRLRIEPHSLPFTPRTHTITFLVYLGEDHRKVILTLPVDTTVQRIKSRLSSELPSGTETNDYEFVEVRSTGERITYTDGERGILFSLSPNSCLFFVPRQDRAKLVPLPVQLNVAMSFLDQTDPGRSMTEIQRKEGSLSSPKMKKSISVSQRFSALEELSVDEIASIFTFSHIQLAMCITASELLNYTMGSEKSGCATPHIRLLVAQFSLIHAWTITQLVTTPVLNKRVHVLKRLIKLADRLISSPFHDQHTCFAIVMALQGAPISRLTQTWDRLPVRWKRLYQNRLLPLIDPARNHRAARNWIAENIQNCLPFLAILLKDLRFAEDGNSTIYAQQQPSRVRLINFEKMRLIARTLHVWNMAISGYEEFHPFAKRMHCPPRELTATGELQLISQTLQSISSEVLESFYDHLDCIDDLQLLNQLAWRIEPKK